MSSGACWSTEETIWSSINRFDSRNSNCNEGTEESFSGEYLKKMRIVFTNNILKIGFQENLFYISNFGKVLQRFIGEIRTIVNPQNFKFGAVLRK